MKKKTEKEQRRKRKIFIAILMLLFTGIIFTTSTYAWFTANRTVTVNNIDVNVAATSGLQLSVDGTNWKPVISNDDIIGASTTYAAAVNQLPISVEGSTTSIVPVSTIGEVDAATGFMKMYEGKVDTSGDNYILTATQSTETNSSTSGSFIAFDLFFNTTAEADIYLTEVSKVAISKGPSGLQNASRIAFLVQGNAAAGAPLETIQGLKAANNTGLYIWEPNFDTHTAAGVKNAKDVYNITTTETGGELLAYKGVKAPITKENNIALNSEDANYFGDIAPTLSTPAAGIEETAYQKIFKLQAGITKVRVYMWIEGQDVDCENNASGSNVALDLQFSMNNAK